MHEGSPNNLSTANPKWGSRSAQSDAKSLLRNILAASPSGSRFYPDPTRPATHKPLRMNTLVDPEEKIVGGGGGGGGVMLRGPTPKASEASRELRRSLTAAASLRRPLPCRPGRR